MKEKLIDVSTWNSNIDWNAVAKSSVKYAMIRSSFGVENPNQVDNKFVRNITSATKAGVKCGVYHYSYAQSVSAAKKEAEFCLKTIKGYKLDLPVAFDIEDSSQTHLSRRTLTDIVIAFCDTVKAAGYKPMLYCNPNWLQNHLYKDELLKRYDIWLAQWGVSTPSYDCCIWQYSENGTVSGISGAVDMNYIYKDYTAKNTTKTKNGDKVKIINKTSFLHYQPIFDDIGGSSRKLAVLKVGTVGEFVYDNGDGWSKIHADSTTGYIQNTRINGTGLSKWRQGTVLGVPIYTNPSDSKPCAYVNKGDKFNIVCLIKSGKYAGWSVIHYNNQDKYIHTDMLKV